jgi:hypothetical protein
MQFIGMSTNGDSKVGASRNSFAFLARKLQPKGISEKDEVVQYSQTALNLDSKDFKMMIYHRC